MYVNAVKRGRCIHSGTWYLGRNINDCIHDMTIVVSDAVVTFEWV